MTSCLYHSFYSAKTSSSFNSPEWKSFFWCFSLKKSIEFLSKVSLIVWINTDRRIKTLGSCLGNLMVQQMFEFISRADLVFSVTVITDLMVTSVCFSTVSSKTPKTCTSSLPNKRMMSLWLCSSIHHCGCSCISLCTCVLVVVVVVVKVIFVVVVFLTLYLYCSSSSSNSIYLCTCPPESPWAPCWASMLTDLSPLDSLNWFPWKYETRQKQSSWISLLNTQNTGRIQTSSSTQTS